MTKHIWHDGDWVPVAALERAPQVGPFIMRDTPAYVSPVTGKVIDGRVARREDLKRSGCREVDPGEFKPVYRNARFAKKNGLQLGGEPIAPVRLPAT
jgi:hypothetical protein